MTVFSPALSEGSEKPFRNILLSTIIAIGICYLNNVGEKDVFEPCLKYPPTRTVRHWPIKNQSRLPGAVIEKFMFVHVSYLEMKYSFIYIIYLGDQKLS